MKKLIRTNNFYLTKSKNLNEFPKVLKINGRIYYKHMGFIYIPCKQEQLTQDQIIQIGNIRNKYFGSLIDKKFVEEVYLFVYGLFKNSGKKILDFGAGSGNFPEFLKRKNLLDTFEFSGIDINSKYKKNRLYKKYQIINSNRKFLFRNNYFDFIISLWVFHYKVPAKNLKEIYRTLKDGGKFIFNLYTGDKKHKNNLLFFLKSIGFSYKRKLFKSGRIFNSLKHSPLEFYICKK